MLTRLRVFVLFACCLRFGLTAIASVLCKTDDGYIVYPVAAVITLTAAGWCWWFARGTRESRTQLMALSVFFGLRCMTYLSATLGSFGLVHTGAAYWASSGVSALQILCALFVLTDERRDGDWRLRALDIVLAVALSLLYLAARSSSHAPLIADVNLSTNLVCRSFLLFVGVMASLGAQTRRGTAIARFFSVYLAGNLLSNLVNDGFLANTTAVWTDVLADSLVGLPEFAAGLFLLLYGERYFRNEARKPPASILNNLLPGSVMITGMILAQFFLPSRTAALWVTSGFVVLGAVRMQILHQEMLKEKQMLLLHAGRLEQLALQDPATGIGNRRYLEQRAGQMLTAAQGERVSLILIDVDHFKQLNDTYGHGHGDYVLGRVAQYLEDAVAELPAASCGRLGGDEFAAILCGMDPARAYTLAEELRGRVQRSFRAQDTLATISVGLACCSGPVSLSHLLKVADQALYRAKSRGRNSVEIAGLEMSPEHEARAASVMGQGSELPLW